MKYFYNKFKYKPSLKFSCLFCNFISKINVLKKKKQTKKKAKETLFLAKTTKKSDMKWGDTMTGNDRLTRCDVYIFINNKTNSFLVWFFAKISLIELKNNCLNFKQQKCKNYWKKIYFQRIEIKVTIIFFLVQC